MRVLKFKSKHTNYYWDASTPERERRALRAMFDYLHEAECYEELERRHQILYRLARDGSDTALRELLGERSAQGYEYETWEWIDVEETADEMETVRLGEQAGALRVLVDALGPLWAEWLRERLRTTRGQVLRRRLRRVGRALAAALATLRKTEV